MSSQGPPALRLLTETLRSGGAGLEASTQHRQLLLDGAGVLRLRRELGNDAYDALETLFILAAPVPGGVVVYGGVSAIADALSWGREKAGKALAKLEDAGYVKRGQEVVQDGAGRQRFGRGVMHLDVNATVSPDQVQEEADAPCSGSLWGPPLDENVARVVLTSWGARDADRLTAQHPADLVSAAVKFTAFELMSGAAIHNPGGYVRTMLTRRQVPSPGPHIPAEFLQEPLTAEQLLHADSRQGARTRQQAEQSAEARRRYLTRILDSLPDEERAAVDVLLEDRMRAFFREGDDVRQVKYFMMLEEELAGRGVLGGLGPQDGG